MKIMNLVSKLCAVAVVAASSLAVSAEAAIVSVNVRDGTIDGTASVTSTFGVASEGTVVGNWTNTNSFGVSAPTNNLKWDDGTNSGVSLTILNPGGQQYWGATYVNTPWNYGPAQFAATATATTLTFNNLTTAFPDGFYAIVYVSGAAANSGARVTDGTTSFYFKTSDPASVTPVLITTTTDPGAGNYQVGNYAKFGSNSAPLIGNTISFSIPVGSIQSNNAGIGGVQLIAVPEPATYALFTGLALLGFTLWRRRRC
jgi:hypothetical protein